MVMEIFHGLPLGGVTLVDKFLKSRKTTVRKICAPCGSYASKKCSRGARVAQSLSFGLLLRS